LRKYLIAAVAALTVVAFAAVASAQGGGATLNTKITPKDAGTKRKPKNSTFNLNVVSDDTRRTMSKLDVFIAKTARLSLKGLPKCDPATIFARQCPANTVLGRGEAKAKVGVNGPPQNVTDRTFEVTAFKTNSPTTGKEMLGFFLDDGGSLQFLPESKLTKVKGKKYGQKLHIDVPELAQHVGATYNGLVSLQATLKKKAGKNKLVATTGCVKHKHLYKTVLTFIDNTVTPAGKFGDTDTARCSK
jgi:hypothetical protein